MKRKQFLHYILPGALGGLLLPAVAIAKQPGEQTLVRKVPPYLRRGSTIGICCTSTPMQLEEIENCKKLLTAWGFAIKVGNSVGDRWLRFAGTDENRAADLQKMLDDDGVDAILFGRGGYGLMRIMDRINWEKFRERPKWLIGFSDITALHCHLQTNFGIASLHAIMCNSFKDFENDSAYSLKMALSGQPIHYQFTQNASNRNGTAQGELVGGNLSMIYAMQASPGELDTRGKILFLEDVGEYKYTVDRMLMNLKRSGKLSELAALVIGGFTGFKEEPEPEFDLCLEEIVMEKLVEYDYPVAFNFPAGHLPQNLALKLGIPYKLNVGDPFCALQEVI